MLTTLFHLVHAPPSRVGDATAKGGALLVEPVLELRRSRHMKTGREVTLPSGERVFPSLRVEQRSHLDRVTSDRRRVQLDVALPA